MNFNDVVALVNAGYTKQEISAFIAESSENGPTEVISEEVSAKDETTAEIAVENTAAESGAAGSAPPSWNDVMLAIKDLTQAVQAGNRHTVQMPAESSATVEDTLRAVSGISATNKKS